MKKFFKFNLSIYIIFYPKFNISDVECGIKDYYFTKLQTSTMFLAWGLSKKAFPRLFV